MEHGCEGSGNVMENYRGFFNGGRSCGFLVSCWFCPWRGPFVARQQQIDCCSGHVAGTGRGELHWS